MPWIIGIVAYAAYYWWLRGDPNHFPVLGYDQKLGWVHECVCGEKHDALKERL